MRETNKQKMKEIEKQNGELITINKKLLSMIKDAQDNNSELLEMLNMLTGGTKK